MDASQTEVNVKHNIENVSIQCPLCGAVSTWSACIIIIIIIATNDKTVAKYAYAYRENVLSAIN